ncbi:hypothetical protein CO115_02070 [Candidatus Falkowbacteria bacterium CG_4_9_14_3_um_filter_36_9]|uniref:Uncharacterized protein n=2 Tax=Candidatus Falkowiibacteriota TaxID=1752728 RepID=A0A1J4T4D9_9BACT|nr:MAG: hypothetical protein AUJ27_03310 [Candidatus Falkowbacteria bacterium CG1_02_37_44]PIV51933.1 MAG: hypothetical protein COS18_01240 [Candidatus Falkowbacteria bacterium CG02_land_8_20_14_3_00_36_14]PJA10725.1 MAG: hypothetical protein COX67_03535 [Candidatus Falkowbacteria bacterium CG_4_10_14_0_2_um_filter_36_22]PJB19900.1 MAG: hypothetical protein CO115_02070 [Candidatus Falkowbacteria bacterium CG_4_9_14_3_um_filter_36_9]
MSNLLSLKFWFNLRPVSLLPIYKNTLIVFVILIFIAYLLVLIINKRNKKNLYSRFWKNLNAFCLANAIISLILLFFNHERISFFSARFWFLVWGIEMIIWLVFIIKKLKEIPKLREQLVKEKEYNKYIP